MSSSIDQSTVEQVARLARIELPETEIEATASQLAEVLEYVSQLDNVKLPVETEPFFGAIESVNAIRQDELTPSADRKMILSNAPETDGEFYHVPPVF